MPEDLKIYELAYVRGLETTARAMLAALKAVNARATSIHPELTWSHLQTVYAAIAQAEAAGIKVEEDGDA